MAALITGTDIENELQITFPDGYGDISGNFITEICDFADALLRQGTNRTSFTGAISNVAKYAELCIAIDRLATSNRDLVKLAIASISENGASISFSTGKTLQSYKDEAKSLISELRLSGTPKRDLTFPDIYDEHTGTEGSILY